MKVVWWDDGAFGSGVVLGDPGKDGPGALGEQEETLSE